MVWTSFFTFDRMPTAGESHAGHRPAPIILSQDRLSFTHGFFGFTALSTTPTATGMSGLRYLCQGFWMSRTTFGESAMPSEGAAARIASAT